MSKDLKLDNWRVLNSILENNKLTTPEKFIAIVILKHRNIYGFKCCPSLDKIIKLTGYSRRTIQRSITELEKNKIIARLKVVNGKRVERTLYFFLDDIELAKELSEDEESFINKNPQYENDYEYFKTAIEKWRLDY